MTGHAATVARMIREPFLETRGIHNFRDYGGWKTRSGGQVRTGLLFRSGHHVEATDEDLAAIAPLGIHTVIDLRGESERAAHPCRRVEGFDGEVLFYDGETTSSPAHRRSWGPRGGRGISRRLADLAGDVGRPDCAAQAGT